jgi:Bifunctional DNA primase/polymerase, N-terminal
MIGTAPPTAERYRLDMMRAALSYAKDGWPIHPCDWRPGIRAKAPLTKHGHLRASTDPQQIADWWIRWPHALIGWAIPEHRAVIDMDPRSGGSWDRISEACKVQALWAKIVWSGRGDGGMHFHYKKPQGIKFSGTRLRKLGADLKLGGRGYVILPPSLHPDTGPPYLWDPTSGPWEAEMPQGLIDIITCEPGDYRYSFGLQSQRALEGILKRVAAEANTRNNVLHWGAMRLVEGGYNRHAFNALFNAAVSTGLPRGEAEKTIRSAMKTLGDAL